MMQSRSPRSRWLAVFSVLLVALSLVSSIPLGGTPQAEPAATQEHRKVTPAFSLSDVKAGDYAPGELVVKLRNPAVLKLSGSSLVPSAGGLTAMLAQQGFHTAQEILPGTYKLVASTQAAGAMNVVAVAEAVQSDPAVEYASPNFIRSTMLTPNDKFYVAGQQWGLTQIKAEQAWDITTGSSSITIAMLDTGVATDHPDLQDKIVPGYNFVANNGNPYDDEGHGTFTAGIAGASSNNDLGITGVSWGARLMPVKVLNSRGEGADATIAQGIRWAVDHGANIISASLGGPDGSPPLRDAVNYAHDHNVLIVAAAGNTPDGKPNFPAAFEPVLAVGATGSSDTYTGFSSWGPYVDVTAPGVGILSTAWINGRLDYDYENGTSAACPFVSGLAALVWSVNPRLTADQVKLIIEATSDDFGDPGWDEHYGYGRIDALKAVQMAQSGQIPPTYTPTPLNQPTKTPQPTATGVPVSGPTLQVGSNQIAPGTLLSILGAGFGPNERIDLSLAMSDGNTRRLGGAETGPDGSFRAEVGLPSTLPAGKSTLTADGQTSHSHATVDLNVTAGKARGNSTIKGTVRGANGGASVEVKLSPTLGTQGAVLTTSADVSGAYSFTGVGAGIYALTASAPGLLPAGPYSVQVDGTANDIKSVDITLSAGRPASFDKVPPVNNTPTQVYFAPVGHTLGGPFLKFWQANGGLAVFGYPLSEEFQEVSPTDGKTYTVQYFERNRFEYHPEFSGTKNEVLMGLLGVELTRGRTFPPGAPFQSDATHVYFPQTQHSLSGTFLTYWQKHGGLAIFGYPISEELVENGYLVQYFERNRFEYHPEFKGTPNEVLLGLLGVEMVRRNGWLGQ